MNGMALHGGIIPFGGTFLIFSDYMRPPIRLAAFMKQHVIYIYTHDSIGLGEDGPTHQPIEQLSALRAIPGITVIRPADATETAEAWRVAIKHKHGPVVLVLTRQKLGFIDRTKYASAGGRGEGRVRARRSADGGKPEVVLMSSGSEVGLIMRGAREAGRRRASKARVVSMPSQELFARAVDGVPGSRCCRRACRAWRSRRRIRCAGTGGWAWTAWCSGSSATARARRTRRSTRSSGSRWTRSSPRQKGW